MRELPSKPWVPKHPVNEDPNEWRIKVAVYEEREKWMFRCLYVFVAGMAVAALIFSFLDLLNSKQ